MLDLLRCGYCGLVYLLPHGSDKKTCSVCVNGENLVKVRYNVTTNIQEFSKMGGEWTGMESESTLEFSDEGMKK